MAERRLRFCQRGASRNIGPAVIAGPVSLATPQCCTHWPGVKFVHSKACPLWAANFTCTSGCPYDNYHNQGPTWGPTAPGLTTKRERNHQGLPISRPDPLAVHCPGRISPRRTGVLNQSPTKRRRVAYLTGMHQHRPHGPSAHRDRRP